MDSCPKELEPYDKAHEKKIRERDYWQHAWWGNYGISALTFSIEHCLAGRKARTKYADKPIFQEIEKRNAPISEEELQRQRELFVAKLEVMKTNFELNHKKENESQGDENVSTYGTCFD